MSDVAFYCPKCGAHCDWPVEEVRGFDPSSGHHKHRYRTVCPNKRRILDGHHKSEWQMGDHEPGGCSDQ